MSQPKGEKRKLPPGGGGGVVRMHLQLSCFRASRRVISRWSLLASAHLRSTVAALSSGPYCAMQARARQVTKSELLKWVLKGQLDTPRPASSGRAARTSARGTASVEPELLGCSSDVTRNNFTSLLRRAGPICLSSNPPTSKRNSRTRTSGHEPAHLTFFRGPLLNRVQRYHTTDQIRMRYCSKIKEFASLYVYTYVYIYIYISVYCIACLHTANAITCDWHRRHYVESVLRQHLERVKRARQESDEQSASKA